MGHRAPPGGQGRCCPSAATTRCSGPGRCAARSSGRSRTACPRRSCSVSSRPGQIVDRGRRGHRRDRQVHLQRACPSPTPCRTPSRPRSRARPAPRHQREQRRRRNGRVRRVTAGLPRAGPPPARPASASTRRPAGRFLLAWASGREREAVVGQRVDQAVGHQAVQGPGPLDRAGPTASSSARRYRAACRAQHGQQRGRGTAGRCRRISALPPRRAVRRGRGHPAASQAQSRGHRAGRAARPGGRADQRAQLHHRDRPAGRHRGLARAAAIRPAAAPPPSRRGRGSGPGLRPATSRASTRRTLVSSTACRCPKAKLATAAAV